MRSILAVSLSCLLVAGCTCGGAVSDPSDDGGSSGTGGSTGQGGGSGGGTGGSTGSDAGVCIPGATALVISPAAQTLTIGAAPSPIDFTATATLPTGSQDVTSRLVWTATRDDDTPAGTFSAPFSSPGGRYQPVPGTGGTITIHATDGCVSATTTLTLKLEATFHDPGTAVTSRFAGTVVTTNAAKTPTFVYPSDHTRFPRNIYKVLFQWKKGGNDAFRLTFDGPGSKVVVYGDGTHPQCQVTAATSGCLETDAALWSAIAGANAGATVTVTVEGVTTGDANVYRAPSIELGFSKRDVKGAIFYWSTTAAGVRRASVSDYDPEPYVVGKPIATVLPNSGGTVKCVACHTVSRSGRKLFGYTQAATTGEYVYDVTLQSPPTQVITTQIGTQRGFGTFRPDDKRVAATVGNLLAEFDADTGAKVADLPVAAGTNPDWSPTGAELAYSDKGGDSPKGAGLKIIAYADGGWGAARTLVAASGQSNLFPSYSPDGTWVAYARGAGGHGDKTLQLWLAKADGTAPPVELVTANRVVNGQTTLGQHENNMPTWAPPGDLHWVAFNSIRPYGVVFPNGGTQQIWVTAIDPAKLGQHLPDGGLVDPTFPAFRFAFQGLAENNHRAFWTLDVRDPPDGGGGPVCAGLGSVCGAGVTCCGGLGCLPNGELGQTCQADAADAGACLASGSACDQTSGAACCGSLVCDVGADGGTQCLVGGIN